MSIFFTLRSGDVTRAQEILMDMTSRRFLAFCIFFLFGLIRRNWLGKIQELSNRTHWTDPEKTWESNSSFRTLLNGVYWDSVPFSFWLGKRWESLEIWVGDLVIFLEQKLAFHFKVTWEMTWPEDLLGNFLYTLEDVSKWNLKIGHLERKMIWTYLNQTSMIMFHVNLQGCSFIFLKVFGLLVWIPGIPLWKGLLLKGTLRIPNHRAND